MLVNNGQSHKEAFKIIAKKLGVTEGTVRAQCTRSNGDISTQEFIDLINNKEIKSHLKKRFPRDTKIIDEEL